MFLEHITQTRIQGAMTDANPFTTPVPISCVENLKELYTSHIAEPVTLGTVLPPKLRCAVWLVTCQSVEYDLARLLVYPIHPSITD